MPSEDELEEIANAIEEKTGKTLEDKSLSGILAQIANQDFNVIVARASYDHVNMDMLVCAKLVNAVMRSTIFDVIIKVEKGTGFDYSRIFSVTDEFETQGQIDVDASSVTFELIHTATQYEGLAVIQEKVGDFNEEPALSTYQYNGGVYLKDEGYGNFIAVDNHAVSVVSDDSDIITEFNISDVVFDSSVDVINVSEEDLQKLVGLQLI